MADAKVALAKGQYRPSPVEPHELQIDRKALAAVRAKRWAQLRSTFPAQRPDIADWAERMSAAYGAVVMVHENVVDWITALYIVRYGENEAFWPAELTGDDFVRALRWERGIAPDNVRYLKAEG